MVSPEIRDVIKKSERLYAEKLKDVLEKTHMHAYVVIEPESGDYFLGPTLSDAEAAARVAYPHRRAYIMRVGHRTAIEMVGLTTLKRSIDATHQVAVD